MPVYGTNKDISKWMEIAVEKGWRVVALKTSHFRMYSPNGKDMLTVSSSKRHPAHVRRVAADFKRHGIL